MPEDEMNEIRYLLLENIKKDLLGPRDPNEKLPTYDAPNAVYEVGKLLPLSTGREYDEIGDNPDNESGDLEENIERAPSEFLWKSGQSNIGLTCRPEGNVEVKITFGIYRFRPNQKGMDGSAVPLLDVSEDKLILPDIDGESFDADYIAKFQEEELDASLSYYQRYEVKEIFEYNNEGNKDYTIRVGEEVFAKLHLFSKRDRLLVTLVNNHDIFGTQIEKNRIAWNQAIIYQPKISVKCVEGFKPTSNSKQLDGFVSSDEINEINYLYKERKQYAIGHNVSASWSPSLPNTVETEFIPYLEIPQIVPTKSQNINTSTVFFGYDNKTSIIAELNKFRDQYNTWIDIKKNEITEEHEDIQIKLMEECDVLSEKITEGIEFLKANENAFVSFQLMNRAINRLNYNFSEYKKNQKIQNEVVKVPDSKDFDSGFVWYDFQLGFLLSNMASLLDQNHPSRDEVSLLWFPTGGGKTEAYTGLLLVMLFYSRYKSRRLNRSQVQALMRYTLRLLTFQQFERALRAISAAELIRQTIPEISSTPPFTVGFWVGSSQFPNRREETFEKLEKEKNQEESLYDSILLLKRCQWCFTEIEKEDWVMENSGVPLKIMCSNQICPYSKDFGIPAYFTDEDIYEFKPSLIVATVDKFARVTWEENTHNLFGSLSSNGGLELIIQDELHLINGPLGSIFGLYETMIEGLMELNKGTKLKYIASTATIRNSREQVKQLFNRRSSVFPPSGIDLTDTYFSKEEKENYRRLYVGLPVGIRSGVYLISRLYARIIVDTAYLLQLSEYKAESIDPYWSIVGYFNSLKELSNVQSHSTFELKNQLSYANKSIEATSINWKSDEEEEEENSKLSYFFNSKVEELNAKKQASQITNILSQMDVSLTSTNTTPFDVIRVLLSSNMLSTGIDLKRLGLMVVDGQPKTTAEYIQATGRVGRSFPGVVFTAYNMLKPRDRSHYENFIQYHNTFYAQVEPMSVTPFANMTISKAIHAIFIGMLRQSLADFNPYHAISAYDDTLPFINDVEEYILNRIEDIDASEKENALLRLTQVKNNWATLSQYARQYKDNLLLSAEDLVSGLYDPEIVELGFPTLNSMRDVDSETGLYKYNLKRRRD